MNPVLNPQPNRDARFIAIIVAVALAAGLFMVFAVFRQQSLVANSGDPYHYGEIARGFVEHGFTTLTRRAASLYPEWLAIIYRLGGNDLVVVLLQSLLHVGTCLLVFSLGRHLYNSRTGFLAALFCALHPMLLRYVPDLHMETFLTFLCTLTIWLTVRFYGQPTLANGVLLGVVGMVTVLTKGVILPYLALFGGISFLLALRKGSAKGVVAVVAMFVTMAVVLAPWTYRTTGLRRPFRAHHPGSQRLFPARLCLHAMGVCHAAEAALHRRRK